MRPSFNRLGIHLGVTFAMTLSPLAQLPAHAASPQCPQLSKCEEKSQTGAEYLSAAIAEVNARANAMSPSQREMGLGIAKGACTAHGFFLDAARCAAKIPKEGQEFIQCQQKIKEFTTSSMADAQRANGACQGSWNLVSQTSGTGDAGVNSESGAGQPGFDTETGQPGAGAATDPTASDPGAGDQIADPNLAPPASNSPSSGSPSSTGGGSMMKNLGIAAGAAALGGLLAYQMGKKKGKSDSKSSDSTDTTTAEENKVILPNGALDCSQKGANLYSDCAQYFLSTCPAGGTATSTATSTTAQASAANTAAECGAFQSRYCSSTTGPGYSENIQLENGAIVQINLSGSGEGLGSGYCQSTVAANFCQSAGRSECPSCRQLATNQSPACLQNPALCLAQNSPDQVAAARTSCPMDPVFSNPNMASIAGGYTAAPGAPAVVLPQVGTSPVNGGTNNFASGVSVQSVSGAVTEGHGATYANGSGAGRGTASQGNTASVGSQHELATSGSRGFASTSNGRMKIVNRRPAGDIEAKFGPSVFAIGSQVIRQHCNQGRLNNCN